MRPIIHSKKHYVQVTLSTVANGAISNTLTCHAIEGAPTTPEQIREGAVVKAVYFEFWLTQASSSVGSFTAGVYKNNNASITAAEAAALHDYAEKKNVFYVTQGLSPANTVQLMPLIKGWIKIPKGKQRFGLDDRLYFFIRNNNGTDDINFCGFATYKEYL